MEECKTIMERFIKHQQYDKGYRELLSVDIVRTFLTDKDDHEQDIFKEHVSNCDSNVCIRIILQIDNLKCKHFERVFL
jgi:sulfur transfer protein SufE